MKKFAFVVFATACLVLQANAQKWKPGVVVLTRGDTIKGQLSVSAIAALECQLMTPDGRSEKYGADQVVSFYIPGELYFQRASINDEWVFMNVLASGQASLLERRGVFYLRDQDNKVTPLEILEQKRVVEGRDYVVRLENYKQVLRDKLTDCAAAQGDIGAVDLSKRSLTRLINKYNSCFKSGSEVVAEGSSKKNVIKPHITLGLEYSFQATRIGKLPIQYGSNATESNLIKFQGQSYPGVYLQVNTSLRGLSLLFSFHSPSYSFMTRRQFVDQTKTGPVTSEYKYDIKYRANVIPVMITYSLGNNRIVQPTMGLGFGLQFNSGFSCIEDYSRSVNINHRITEMGSVKPRALSFLYSVGVNVNAGSFRIGASANLEFLGSPIRFNDFYGDQSNVGATLSVGYAFIH